LPTWKKIIVSGSDAHITSLSASVSIGVGNNQIIGITQATTYITGSFTGSFTGNGSGLTNLNSASYSTTASYALNSMSASFATTASYVRNAVSSSFAVNSVTASYYGGTVLSASYASTASYLLGTITSASYASTASYLLGTITSASYSVTASYATTASYLIGGAASSNVKGGYVSAISFTGTPRTATVTFGSSFSDSSYAVTITGEDIRVWSIESKSSTGFTINTNSNVDLTNSVYWIATAFSS